MDSISYFNRVFKKAYGVTPTAFRVGKSAASTCSHEASLSTLS
ncbi:AraC family transcriptional regulator [Paenibacillus sp. BAC0078]